VIKGWDIGIRTMTVGELSHFKILPEYAYGLEGVPPLIPPNETLIFEIELLEIKQQTIHS
jgi:FKBP-type peptidyl-prolyl cis-trans isomerase